MSTSRTPRPLFWFKTISTSTARRHSTKPFPAAEARRLVERFEWHYTPKHGSWLDLAEVRNSAVLSSQCLDRRIPDKQTLVEEIAAWEQDRNANHTKANWQFTTPPTARHQNFKTPLPFNLSESGDLARLSDINVSISLFVGA